MDGRRLGVSPHPIALGKLGAHRGLALILGGESCRVSAARVVRQAAKLDIGERVVHRVAVEVVDFEPLGHTADCAALAVLGDELTTQPSDNPGVDTGGPRELVLPASAPSHGDTPAPGFGAHAVGVLIAVRHGRPIMPPRRMLPGRVAPSPSRLPRLADRRGVIDTSDRPPIV